MQTAGIYKGRKGSMKKWKSTKDRLPNCEEKTFYMCLVYIASKKIVTSAMFNTVTKNFLDINFNALDASHWMPLPEPPKE
jgi:membrane-bound lytic murein transglycosylase MltF